VPKYQQDALSTFFGNYSPPYPYYSALSADPGDITTLPDVDNLSSNGGIYNRVGRGFPDVSANGWLTAVRDPILSTVKQLLISAV